jgi:ferredoxin-NADP reductase/predicted pyridoxine 5'-phosphate oxidase superfamily flavin-nucleotide-binding protein
MSENAEFQHSPFHPGEQQVQERLGVRDKIESFARKVVRDHLPRQHREFYAELPFALIGTTDAHGRPWASLISGAPGFLSSPDASTLRVAARAFAGDPLAENLRPGADVSVLGIQLDTRRRNRLTGQIASIDDDGFSVSVDQAFGHCPQYIQTRSSVPASEQKDRDTEHPIHRSKSFDARSTQIISDADTFFIATATPERPPTGPRSPALGVDVSHRGGKPGFVRVEDERTLIFPEFSGNNHFNTVGNLTLNPKAGLLFADFDRGDLVYLTGSVEIIWNGSEVQAFKGAQRLIRVTAESVIRVENALTLDFAFGEFSPTLAQTGDWAETEDILAAEREKNIFAPYEIVDIQEESDVISSFYLRRGDGRKLAPHNAGQFLPIRVAIPGREEPLVRNYTLSVAPGGDFYRLSIKREGGNALVSNFVHEMLKVGDIVEAMTPRGKFVLDRSSERPVVLISGGVGITPMIAMANSLIDEGERTGTFRRIHFIHGAQNGAVHAFGDHIRTLAEKYPNLSAHIRYSEPSERDQLIRPHDSVGFIDMDLLKSILPFDDYDFYLCGPQPFMQSIYDGLIATGVRDARIHYESFGPATVLRRPQEQVNAPKDVEESSPPVAVKFARSGIETTWSADQGTLLELAQSAGLNPDFACRSGICGTCATRIKSGTVDYVEEPSAPRSDDEVLICCATPRSTISTQSCGDAREVILDL